MSHTPENPEDGLRDALQRMSDAVRPAAGATDTIHDGVRRSRRRRALGTVVGTAGLVVAVAAGGSALTRSASEPTPVEPVPATSSTSSTSPSAADVASDDERGTFVCSLQGLVVGDDDTVEDLVGQRRVVRRVLALSSVRVRHAAATPTGVVALVEDDDVADGRFTLAVALRLRAAGVAHVGEWDPTAAASGIDAAAQVRRVLTQTVRITVRDARECRSAGR